MSIFKSKFLLGVMIVAVMFVGVIALASSAKAASDCTITKTLKQKMSGSEVTCLQNKLGVTPATGYFGTKTLKAVKDFQTTNGLKADGAVGPKTIAALASVVISDNGNGGTPAAQGNCPTGYVAVTPVAPSFAACVASAPAQGNCPTGYVAVTPVAPTFASCAPATGPVISSTGEGSITVDYNPIPSANVVIKKGQNGQAAVAFKLKATGSDMKVTRLWLDVDKRLWLFANSASLVDGSTVLGTIPLTSASLTEVNTGTLWQLQFNGLNVIVPVGTTKVLTVNLDRPELTQAYGTVTVQASTSVRAVDGANISNAPTVGTTRGINLQQAAASVGTLTNGLNANSPKDMAITGISTTAGVLTPVKLVDFDLKATDAPVTVTNIAASLSASAGTLANEVASVELRDGTTVLASATGAGSVTFSDFGDITIAQDATKTLSIWAQMNPIGTPGAGYTNKGAGITATVGAVTANSGSSFSDVSTSNSVAGYTMYMYKYAPTITLGTVSALQEDESVSTTVNKGGTYVLDFTVTAPTGSDIYVDTATILAGVAKTDNKGGTLTDSISVKAGDTTMGSTWTAADKIIAGTSRTFEVSATIVHGGTPGFTGIKLGSFNWSDTDNNTTPTPIAQAYGLGDFHTGKVNITAN